MKKETVYLPEMPNGLIIETSEMIIVGTGEKYKPKGEKQHERVLSITQLQV